MGFRSESIEMLARLLALVCLLSFAAEPLAAQSGGRSANGAVVDSYRTPFSPFQAPRSLTLRDTPQMSGPQRAALVRRRLDRLITRYGSEPQSAYVESHQGPVVVRTKDGVLATVLDEDLPDYYHQLSDPEVQLATRLEVAERWRAAIQAELDQGAFLYSADYLRLAVWLGLGALALALLIHFTIKWASRRYFHRPLWPLLALNWLTCVSAILWVSPSGRTMTLTLARSVLRPYVWLGVVVMVAWLAYSLGVVLIHLYLKSLVEHRQEKDQRIDQRVAALTQAISSAFKALVVVVAVVAFLAPFDINWTPLATGAGVLGVTLSLAAQDFMRDLVAGASILLEDQFGLGDWIVSGTYSGEVERFALRATQLRTMDGALITIPNSLLRPVSNLSKEWARVDFSVEVSYKDDVDRALQVLDEEIRTLAGDWKEHCEGEPEVLGVDKLKANGVSLRALLRTRPLRQWEVKRELNRRIKLRYDQEGISIAYPQREVWLHSADVLEATEAPEPPEGS